MHLLWVMLERGGDRQRLLLYENNLLDVVVGQLQNSEEPEELVHCLKCIRSLLNAAVKLSSLELCYTNIIKADLEKRPGLRARLEGLITHPAYEVSNEVLGLLNSYLDNGQL